MNLSIELYHLPNNHANWLTLLLNRAFSAYYAQYRYRYPNSSVHACEYGSTPYEELVVSIERRSSFVRTHHAIFVFSSSPRPTKDENRMVSSVPDLGLWRPLGNTVRTVIDVMILSTMHSICFNSKVKECGCCTNNTSYLSHCLQTRHVSTFASSKVSDEIYFRFENERLPLQ